MNQNVPYSGADNLEVMREAKNYNNFLLATIRRHAPPNARTLDFGAGGGQFACPLAERGADVLALEPDRHLREHIRSRGVASVGNPAEVADRSIDYVYTLNVLEHIEDDVAALRQLRAKLKNDGVLLIYVPAFPVLYTAMDAKVGHIRRYTRTSLVKAVSAAGFAIEKVAYVDCLGFFATLLFKVAGSQQGNINMTALKIYDRIVFPISRVLDAVTGRWIGKNLLLLARVRASTDR